MKLGENTKGRLYTQAWAACVGLALLYVLGASPLGEVLAFYAGY